MYSHIHQTKGSTCVWIERFTGALDNGIETIYRWIGYMLGAVVVALILAPFIGIAAALGPVACGLFALAYAILSCSNKGR